jgi:2-polyprenyl-3-methyl-5-hydroxy-6-metoxy-1,4-benzoquinol methylase
MTEEEQREDVRGMLASIARRYPPDLVPVQLADIERTAFHIGLVGPSAGRAVCDLGGGIGLFSAACAALGMRAILVDDFRDPINLEVGPEVLELHRSYGVEVQSRDLIEEGISLPPGSLDAVTSFDSVEHWHHSPKLLFHAALEALRPGGAFVLGAPNCVNLRKRLTVLAGSASWSRIEEWYESERFRGHVREPDVGDLRYVARDLGLREVRILGRNWLGLASPSRAMRLATAAADRVLRARPSLCSDIYLVGRKPAS